MKLTHNQVLIRKECKRMQNFFFLSRRSVLSFDLLQVIHTTKYFGGHYIFVKITKKLAGNLKRKQWTIEVRAWITFWKMGEGKSPLRWFLWRGIFLLRGSLYFFFFLNYIDLLKCMLIAHSLHFYNGVILFLRIYATQGSLISIFELNWKKKKYNRIKIPIKRKVFA